jgi:mRNA-degrading endonuclease RelE of RelBE toxin-antitoxin system
MAPKKSKPAPAAAKTSPTTWIVEYHWQAVEDLKSFNDREQKGVLTVADFLRQLGTKIKEPHMKPIIGERKIRELRPGGGRVLVRPLYFQADERTFKIVAIAPESQSDPSGFEAAVKRARDRAKRDYGVEI